VLLVFILAVSSALIVSSACSVFEAILLTLSTPQIALMRQTHPKQAEGLQALKDNIEQPITAILTLNTLAHTMGASVSGAAAVALFGQEGLVWFSLAFTLAILLFTEILPKTFGVTYARQLAPYVVWPLQVSIFILKPLIYLGQLLTRLVPRDSKPHIISAEELKTIASFSRESGVIQADQEAVIANVLQLGAKTVRDVMTPRTVTFSLDQNLTIEEVEDKEELLRMHSRVPIYDGEPDEVTGIVLSQDVLLAAAEGKSTLRLEQLRRPVHFVPETTALDRVFIEFFEHYLHLFVVVDEYGSVTGVISMEDVLEEIIGREIVDEFDKTRNMRELAMLRKKKLHTQPGHPNSTPPVNEKGTGEKETGSSQ
jgi:CBS domain containing-hemolysin-like protein